MKPFRAYPLMTCAKAPTLLIKIRVKKFADRRALPASMSGFFSRATRSFVFSLGILSSCCPHLTIAGRGIGARLDRLSVRCLSSYLIFCPYSGDKYACRMAGVCRAVACVPSFFPLHELGYSEELVTLNFRALGTRYSPVLLCFGLLLLGGLALHSSASWQLTATGRSTSIPEILADSDVASNRPSVHVDLGQLPLRFEPNQGQTDPQVNFLARGAGYGLFLTPDQAVLTLHSPYQRSLASVVRMQLAGANRAASATGAGPLPGKSNYFIGNDPAQVASRHSAICASAISGCLSRRRSGVLRQPGPAGV